MVLQRKGTPMGWLSRIQILKHTAFMQIIDGSCAQSLQIAAPKEMAHKSVTRGCLVECKGQLVKSLGAGQAVDLVPESLTVVGECSSTDFPIISFLQGKQPDESLRQYLHLRCRTIRYATLMRLRNAATHAVHRYFQENDYLQVHTPIITSNDCEGAGETFEVKGKKEHFFGNPAYLTVSGQLHLEALTGAFHKVYTFSPTFRAENSPGRLHMAEFYMIEAEMNFTETVEDLNTVIESLLKSVTRHLVENHEDDLAQFWDVKASKGKKVKENGLRERAELFLDKPFIRLDYDDAIKELEDWNDAFKVKIKGWGDDLHKEHEVALVSRCGGGLPIFVMNYPGHLKPFYCRANDDQQTVACLDLLAPNVGELCGGSLREERGDILQKKLVELGLEKSLDWYMDLRRFGGAPHSGFGIGFERYLMMLLGFDNIRDTLPFPRSVRQCKL